jgi:predicted nucleic acid-binding protein
MSYIADTDITADYLNGQPFAITLLDSLVLPGLAISLVTYGEIYDGIYDGRNPQAAERAFLQFLRPITVLPLTKSIMKEFARIRAQLRHAGMIIGDDDIMIAATAVYHHLDLVTRNVRHFGRIPYLTIYQQP